MEGTSYVNQPFYTMCDMFALFSRLFFLLFFFCTLVLVFSLLHVVLCSSCGCFCLPACLPIRLPACQPHTPTCQMHHPIRHIRMWHEQVVQRLHQRRESPLEEKRGGGKRMEEVRSLDYLHDSQTL